MTKKVPTKSSVWAVLKMKRVLPPLLLSIFLISIILLGRYLPVVLFLRAPFNWIGAIPILAGLLIIASALCYFRNNNTTIKPFKKPRNLVTGGVCRYTRNPMYMGETLILAGAWLFTGAVSPVFAVIIFALIADRWFVRSEEAMLLESFGQEYKDYCHRTRRWI